MDASDNLNQNLNLNGLLFGFLKLDDGVPGTQPGVNFKTVNKSARFGMKVMIVL